MGIEYDGGGGRLKQRMQNAEVRRQKLEGRMQK
jgi:hypothetical protein